MKHLRKLAGLTVFLIGVFMVIALIRYQTDATVSMLPERLEYDFNEGWSIGSLDTASASEITLPYIEKQHTTETMVFQNTLSEDFVGMTMHFSTENEIGRAHV